MDPAPEPSVDPDPLAINLRLLHDFLPVFRIRIQIRIHRIHLAIPDPHPDPLVREEFIRGSFMIRIRSKMSRIPNSALKNDVNVPSKEISRKTFFFNWFIVGILKLNNENSRIRIQDLDPDPLVIGMDPRIRIRIHTKMSWIRNTDCNCYFNNELIV
jgi:hypothetical protein